MINKLDYVHWLLLFLTRIKFGHAQISVHKIGIGIPMLKRACIKISAGNILTSISDHVTQYLLISNQTEVSLNSSKKETTEIRNFNKKYVFWNKIEI